MPAYFTDDEFRCPDCGLFIPNDELRTLLQKAREALGRPMIIESGTRCAIHNAQVGGVKDSAHTTGEAADIRCLADDTRWALLKIFFLLGVKRLEVGKTWIHVDVSKTKPQKVCFLP